MEGLLDVEKAERFLQAYEAVRFGDHTEGDGGVTMEELKHMQYFYTIIIREVS